MPHNRRVVDVNFDLCIFSFRHVQQDMIMARACRTTYLAAVFVICLNCQNMEADVIRTQTMIFRFMILDLGTLF